MAQGKILETLLFNIEARTASLQQGLNDAKSKVNNFTSTLAKVGGAVGVAFAVKQVVQFGAECAKLAGEAAGVANAFDKIPGSTTLLKDLQKATQGTVSELNLMKRAVQFKNFNLDLAQLPKLLEFATKRANETGQSVDYLVDSMVTGLGRKSVLILDNLGISSADLNAEIAKTGDFMTAAGVIVDRELKKMGDGLDTNVVKAQRFAASWENLKIAIGTTINSSGISEALDFFSLLLGRTTATADEMKVLVQQQKFWNEERKKAIAEGDRKAEVEAIQILAKLSYLTGDLKDKAVEWREEKKKEIPVLQTIQQFQERLTELQEQQITQTGQQLAQTNREIKSIEDKIKALKELGTIEESLSYNQKQTEKDLTKTGINNKVVGAAGNVNFGKPTLPQDTKLLTTEQDKVYQLTTAWEELGETMEEVALYQGVNSIDALGDSIGGLLANSQGAFKNFAVTVVNSIFSIIDALQKQMIAAVLATEAKKGLVGIAFAGIALAAFKGLFQREVGAYANGGVTGGGLAVVGERGRELVHMPAGSRVYNHSDTKRMLGDNGGGIEVVIRQVQRGEDLYSVVEEVKRRRGKSK